MFRVGAVCQIVGCKEIPGIDGSVGQIMDLQTSETDNTRAYPLWIEVLSGGHKSGTFGFNYNEVEVVTPRIELAFSLSI